MNEENLELLQEEMATKSDAELNKYLLETHKYSASELSTAIRELKNRGRVFNGTEWEQLLSIIRVKLWGENPSIPSYFSKKAIFLFSLFFSVLYGMIILSLNLHIRREKSIVIGFGLTFLIAQLIFVNMFPIHIWYHVGLHVLGCAVISTQLWKRYIGINGLYKRKAVDVQIFLGLVLSTFLMRAIHFCAGHQDFEPFYCMGKDLVNILHLN